MTEVINASHLVKFYLDLLIEYSPELLIGSTILVTWHYITSQHTCKVNFISPSYRSSELIPIAVWLDSCVNKEGLCERSSLH